MNDAQVIDWLTETDAYAPETPLPETVSSPRSALSEIERRIGMQTQTPQQTTRLERRRIRRPLAAAAAFAAVIAAVGLAGWFSFGRDGGVAAGLTVVEDFAEAVSSETNDVLALVTEDATYGPMTVPLDQDLASFWAGLDTTLQLSDCTQTEQLVTCRYEQTDALREALGRPEQGTMTFLIEDSRIGAIDHQVDAEASGWLGGPEGGDPVLDYMAWLSVSYPGWEQELDWAGEPGSLPGRGSYAPLAHDDPRRNARYAEVLTRHLDEYVAELEATGGLPEIWEPDRWQVLKP